MITPLKNRIIVQLKARQTHTESGLTIPEDAQEREQTGSVLSIGSEVRDVTVGDTVLLGKHDGVKLDNKYADNISGEILLLTEDHVRAILN